MEESPIEGLQMSWLGSFGFKCLVASEVSPKISNEIISETDLCSFDFKSIVQLASPMED